MKIKISVILFLLSLASCSKQSDFQLVSPNGELKVIISNLNNSSAFTVIDGTDTILRSSNLGLKINGLSLTENVMFRDFKKTEVDETWETIIGKQRTVNNHYNAYKWQVATTGQSPQFYEIVFRLYDKGFAYRYEFPSEAIQDSIKIDQELTGLNFRNDFTYWAYNGEKHNVGPINSAEKNAGEVKIPMVMQFNDDSFMAIHEAEITEFAPFTIATSTKDQSLEFNINYSKRDKPFKTSWRAFMLGEKAGDLVESDLLVNLNEPIKISDPSWIKGGKSLWDWRVLGFRTDDGFEYQLNTESHKRMIDFASANNIQYLLIDADWYGDEFSESSDPTTTRDGVDIEECMRYATANNIGIILYLNDVGAKKFGLERVLKQFSEWGAIGVKYGFMQGGLEEKVKHTRAIVELCAKYKLMVNFHDNPIPPSGDRRTWPNLITKEFGHAQGDAKYSHYPETSVNQVLINQIAGPLDFTNGWFDLDAAHIGRPKVFEEIPGTVVAEVAKLITIYSGWMVLPDSPEAYLEKEDLFDCIRKMPAQFDSFKVLDAGLDNYVSVARKAGEDWFVGSLTNREARSITLDLSFLSEKEKYEAILYEDAENSDYLSNKESYTIRSMPVNANTKLVVRMSNGGGHVMYIKKISNKEE
ncbi:glycoside hydrolase family 97 catalytic domain-containing protein [Cyclobacterium sp. 1_MG-2023]|uniref:glycoside hydrolase family 97 protein n=1 Tax=Cyclobacterium sp. 1_MG-2023 TaxID=3062681 RepID=UPI0026E2EC9E|nr:glycoside hydrolase family 97 protein [Cyclobacterium sp. 1_MG-2023]MDO6438978.1 glycoside hydrolase family 97 catalytic domain-containing protein [Cyclobacterium sp. 1_MG-2023]